MTALSRRLGLGRPAFVRILILAVVLALGVSLVNTLAAGSKAAPGEGARRAQDRPNVIVVFADDMRLTDLQHLPGIQRLADRGVRFDRGISADSLCCPARATLLTGKLAHNHRTLGNSARSYGGEPVFAAENPPSERLPAWMQDAGYRTGYIGKYLNSSPNVPFRPPNWDYFAVPYKRIYTYRENVFTIQGRTVERRGYREAFQRELLMDRVRQWSPSDTPYLLFYSSLAPHSAPEPGGGWMPPIPGEGHADDRVRGITRNPATREKDVSTKPRWLRRKAGNKVPYFKREAARQRIRALMSVEDTVVALEKYFAGHPEEAERTILVFTSDNGYLLGEHKLTGKNYAYQQSLRIPLTVTGPGFPAGTINDSLVGLQDVAVTAMTAAGITDSHDVDGVPLQGVVSDPGDYADRAMVIEGAYGGYGGRWRDHHDAIGRFYRGATTRTQTYVEYADGLDSYVGGSREFYDRARDGHWELVNRIDDPDYAPQRDRLVAWFQEHMDCAGPACNEPLSGQPTR